MNEIKHTSLKSELLYLIGRATAPISCSELYERCELADEVVKVIKATGNLVSDGKIVRVEGAGRARYTLAAGVAAPAPAGKHGRSKGVQADDAGAQVLPVPPAVVRAAPRPEIPTQRGDVRATPDHIAGAGKMVEPPPGADAGRLADAIIARLKTDLGPMLRPYIGESIETETGAVVPSVHIHIEQVDIHLGGL